MGADEHPKVKAMKRRLVQTLKRQVAQAEKRTGKPHRPALYIGRKGRARAYAVEVDDAGEVVGRDPLLVELDDPRPRNPEAFPDKGAVTPEPRPKERPRRRDPRGRKPGGRR